MRKSKLYAAGGAAVLVSGIMLAVPLSGANAAAKPQPAGARAQLSGTPVSVAPGGNGLASVTCPANTVATGGGGQTSGFDIFFTDSFASGNGWVIRGSNRGTTTQTLTAFAVCLGQVA